MADSVRWRVSASEMAIKMEITARQIHFFFVVFFLSFFFVVFCILLLLCCDYENVELRYCELSGKRRENGEQQQHRSSCLVALGHTAHLVEL